MIAQSNHPEDIRAAIRKKYGSLAAFERKRDLPAQSTRDVLRGKAIRNTAVAIADELGTTIEVLFPEKYKSHIRDNIKSIAVSHPLNAGAN